MSGNRKEQARKLRLDGKSVKQIARMIGASSSSVSLWVRDIELTTDQMEKLGFRSPASLSRVSCANAKMAEAKRREWQSQGAGMYDRGERDYAFGCALFMGEGSKARNAVKICNTDPTLLRFFVDFIRKHWGVKDDGFCIRINCYLNNGLSLDQIQAYWLKVLGLPESCVRKATIKSKYYDGHGSHKYPYGVCSVCCHRVDIAQNLFGSIKRALGDETDRWL